MDPAPQSQLTIRTLKPEDIPTLVPWSTENGWLYTEADLRAFLVIDPAGLFVCEVEGKVMGCLFTLKCGDYSFSPLFAVNKEYRRTGYGAQLRTHALEYLKGTVMGVDVAQDAVTNREGLGFKTFCQVPIYRKQAGEGKRHEDLIDLKDVPVDQVTKYDHEIYGYLRNGYTAKMLEVPTTHGFAVMKDGKLTGIGILRKMPKENSYSMGPLYADDAETAKKLVDGLESCVTGNNIYVVTFDVQKEAQELFKEWPIYLTEVRMYLGEPPKMDLPRIFGVYE